MSVGDIVTLIGKDDFGEKISILEFSEWTETIPNEILSQIGDRGLIEYIVWIIK